MSDRQPRKGGSSRHSGSDIHMAGTSQAASSRRGSPRLSPSVSLGEQFDPDAPIPSVEPVSITDRVDPTVRLSRLPFYDNFGALLSGVRFPNPVDVRNRHDFGREASADLSRDPFETRVLMNGLKIGQVWPMEHKDRPPYFDVGCTVSGEEARQMVADYFPGINMYPELRSPPGSQNLFGEHWAYLALSLADAEGLLARNEELRSDHILALIRWQLLDFTDIHRFIVMPVHTPGHFALGIYDRATDRLGSIDTHPNAIERNRNYRRIVTICKSFIKEGCPGVKEPKAIRVGVSPQTSVTNCGWQVANYVAFFFRENRGRDNWEFGDWKGSNLAKNPPMGLSPEETAVQIWMYAIRSELNGTGHGLRQPVNCPLIGLDEFRQVKAKHGLISQPELIKMELHDEELYAHPPDLPVRRLPTEMVMRGLVDRAGRVDLHRPIDHRVSRVRSEQPLTSMLAKLSMGDKQSHIRAKTVGLQPIVTKMSLRFYQIDGHWNVEPDNAEIDEKLKPRYDLIRAHNAWAHRYVTARSAMEWVPMPAIQPEFRGWTRVIQAHFEDDTQDTIDQVTARDRRAERRRDTRGN
ncbi:hypothetical protein F5883DRAFT_646998 [Diaporthe sp. PMI_573]|nr:hypothetical protein F5883DRAFT_646998 [Diaporthaceae sp. PMI_573]